MILDKKNAICIFYYLMAVDDNIKDVELEQLDMIGREIDGEEYASYKDSILLDCEKIVREADGEELYDILMENIDNDCVPSTSSIEESVPSRLLIWNMLVIAYSNQEYADAEKRMIHHVARKCALDKSVVMEMEAHIQTLSLLENQLHEYGESNLPYCKVRPIVDELEIRRDALKKCVTELISDELYERVEKLEVEDDFVDKTRNYVKEKTAPVVEASQNVIGNVWEEFKSKIGSVVSSNDEGKEQQ